MVMRVCHDAAAADEVLLLLPLLAVLQVDGPERRCRVVVRWRSVCVVVVVTIVAIIVVAQGCAVVGRGAIATAPAAARRAAVLHARPFGGVFAPAQELRVRRDRLDLSRWRLLLPPWLLVLVIRRLGQQEER